VTIIHGNCHDADPAVLVSCHTQISDFPYSEYVHANAMSSRTLASGGPVSRDLGYAPRTQADIDFATAVAACLPRWSILFTDLESTHLWRDAAEREGVEYIRQWDWIRWVQPQQSGDRPGGGCEAVMHFHAMGEPNSRGKRKPIAKRWNGDGGATHYDTKGIRGNDKRQGQKPIALGLTLVSWFSDPGERILDLTTGAGTFPLAARLLGREAVGYEIDAEWAGFAAERERAALCVRDLNQAKDWCDEHEARAAAVEVPKPPATDRCWRRAQRRLADVARVRKAIK
jgi:hypothetical protein